MENRKKITKITGTALVVPALVLAIGTPMTGGIAVAHASTPTLTKVKSVKVSNVKTNGFKVTWTGKNAASKVKGYQVRVYRNSTKIHSYSIGDRKVHFKYVKNLKSGAKYKVKVRAYRVVSGKKSYGAWSSYKSVRTNKVAAGDSSFLDAMGDVKYTVTGTEVRAQGTGKVLLVRYRALNVSDSKQIMYPGFDLRAKQNGNYLSETVYLDELGSHKDYTLKPGASRDGWIAYTLNGTSPVTLSVSAAPWSSKDTLKFKRVVSVG